MELKMGSIQSRTVTICAENPQKRTLADILDLYTELLNDFRHIKLSEVYIVQFNDRPYRWQWGIESILNVGNLIPRQYLQTSPPRGSYNSRLLLDGIVPLEKTYSVIADLCTVRLMDHGNSLQILMQIYQNIREYYSTLETKDVLVGTHLRSRNVQLEFIPHPGIFVPNMYKRIEERELAT